MDHPRQPISLPLTPPSFSPNLAQEIGVVQSVATVNLSDAEHARQERRWMIAEKVFEGIGDEINAIWEWARLPWWKRLFLRPDREALLHIVRNVDFSDQGVNYGD